MNKIHISDLSPDTDSFLTELQAIDLDRIYGGGDGCPAGYYKRFSIDINLPSVLVEPLAATTITPDTTATDGKPVTFNGPGFSYTTNTYAGGTISTSSGRIGNGQYFYTSGAIPPVCTTGTCS